MIALPFSRPLPGLPTLYRLHELLHTSVATLLGVAAWTVDSHPYIYIYLSLSLEGHPNRNSWRISSTSRRTKGLTLSEQLILLLQVTCSVERSGLATECPYFRSASSMMYSSGL